MSIKETLIVEACVLGGYSGLDCHRNAVGCDLPLMSARGMSFVDRCMTDISQRRYRGYGRRKRPGQRVDEAANEGIAAAEINEESTAFSK